jgi:hypothetical protein
MEIGHIETNHPIIREMFPGLVELYTAAIEEIDTAVTDVVISTFFVTNGRKFPSPENNLRDALIRACGRGVRVHLIYSLQICERYMTPLQRIRWFWGNRMYDYEVFHIDHPNFHIHFPFNTEYEMADDAVIQLEQFDAWETALLHWSNASWVKRIVHQKYILIDTQKLFWGEMNIDQYLFDPIEPQFLNLSARLEFDATDMALFRRYVDSMIHAHTTTPPLPQFMSGNFGDKNTEVERIIQFIESSNEFLWIENQWFHVLQPWDGTGTVMTRIINALVEKSLTIPVFICSMGELEETGLMSIPLKIGTANSKAMLRTKRHNIEYYYQRHTVLHTKFFMNESAVHWTTANLNDPAMTPGMNLELALSLTHPEDMVKFRDEIWGQHMRVGNDGDGNQPPRPLTFESMRDHIRTCDEFVPVDLNTWF